MNPWPIAYTYANGKTIKIYSVEAAEGEGEAGKVLSAKGTLTVACGKGVIVIRELQQEGSKRMSAKEFLNGNRIAEGDRFGND